MRLSPDAFWGLSIIEWRVLEAVFATTPARLDADGLAALRARYERSGD